MAKYTDSIYVSDDDYAMYLNSLFFLRMTKVSDISCNGLPTQLVRNELCFPRTT